MSGIFDNEFHREYGHRLGATYEPIPSIIRIKSSLRDFKVKAREMKDLPSLQSIIGKMPANIKYRDINRFVNEACGLKEDDMPSPLNTYGMEEILDEMRTQGYYPSYIRWDTTSTAPAPGSSPP